MKKKAIYPGSFDPIANGHIDIIRRARTIFDEVVVAVFDNPFKQPFFSFKERVSLIASVFEHEDGVSAEMFKGLLVDFSVKKDIYTIIRGLRAVSDFDYEFQMAVTNQKLSKSLETVFFMTDDKNSYLSSSLVRQLAYFDGDVSAFVPIQVQKALKKR